MVTNTFTSPLTGGSPEDPDFSLGVSLSADSSHSTGSDVVLGLSVASEDSSKLHTGIDAGDSVLIQIDGTFMSCVTTSTRVPQLEPPGVVHGHVWISSAVGSQHLGLFSVMLPGDEFTEAVCETMLAAGTPTLLLYVRDVRAASGYSAAPDAQLPANIICHRQRESSCQQDFPKAKRWVLLAWSSTHQSHTKVGMTVRDIKIFQLIGVSVNKFTASLNSAKRFLKGDGQQRHEQCLRDPEDLPGAQHD